jgi:hypothetical protein
MGPCNGGRGCSRRGLRHTSTMVLLITAWLIVAIILLAVDVRESVRKTRGKRNPWGRAMIWAFALGLMAFAIFWFTH